MSISVNRVYVIIKKSLYRLFVTLVLVLLVSHGAAADGLRDALARRAQPARAPSHLLQELVTLVTGVQTGRRWQRTTTTTYLFFLYKIAAACDFVPVKLNNVP